MLGALLLGGVFWSLRMFVVDPDMWWHVKVGEGILATHHWPTMDPYSFTVAGQPWIAYEWLGEVLLAAANRLGGNKRPGCAAHSSRLCRASGPICVGNGPFGKREGGVRGDGHTDHAGNPVFLVAAADAGLPISYS